MEEILEIRDGCNTPAQLLRSLAFARYMKIYKRESIEYLEDYLHKVPESRQSDVRHRMAFINNIELHEVVNILEGNDKKTPKQKEHEREIVRFLDNMFHHYRGSGYSRVVRLQNEVVADNSETPDTIKEKVTQKAIDLSDLILHTRRMLLGSVNLDKGVRRTQGMSAMPNVTSGEISGHYLNLAANYASLAHVPLTIAADIKTGIDYKTPSNKRALPFYELAHNPFKPDVFQPEHWVAVALQVGASLIVAYIHKSRGCIEMEPGLLNLFPFAEVDDIKTGHQPDGVFFFGDPNAQDEDLGYYWDEANNILVGCVPNRDILKYFGYAKKPILTLHNVLTIKRGEIPLHCGCTRYEMHFGESSGEPYISDMLVKADDMGRTVLEEDAQGVLRPMFYGTETGAFACLDGFSEHAKAQMQGREVGYNQATGSNARQIVPVSEPSEVADSHELDVLLYMNNYDLIEQGENTINTNMSQEEAINHFRLGERVAAGSTHTHRGAKETSYWANPFPMLKLLDGEILHPDLYEQFQQNETRFINATKPLLEKKELLLGVAHSQLMAGAAACNSDEDIERCGYASRDDLEHQGPERLAEDMITLIKQQALLKRKRLGGVDQLNITVALVGDSRTGKSETAEKMDEVLHLQLV